MTNKEMSEIFGIWLLAYPKAEVFSGGVAKLEPTVKLWAEMFKSVDFETGKRAALALVQSSPYPPTIAEYNNQLRKLIINSVTVIPVLWDKLLRATDRIAGKMYGFNFNAIEADGRTTGERKRDEAMQIYQSLPIILKDYAGSYSGMLTLTREYESLTEQSLAYEKTKFENYAKSYLDGTANISELAQIAESVKPMLPKGE